MRTRLRFGARPLKVALRKEVYPAGTEEVKGRCTREFSEGKTELMDSSLHNASLIADELKQHSAAIEEAEVESAEEEHHIHLPNPSLWPLILSAAILVTVAGLLGLPDSALLTYIGAPFIIVGIMGWALEDPMAAPKERYKVFNPNARFQLGQEVLDKNEQWLGTVKARFGRYILAERGDVFAKVLYVPHEAVEEIIKGSIVRLNVSEDTLLDRGLDVVPDDLYDDAVEPVLPSLNGTPLFGRGQLSPAQTGHYNYGPNYPGINTDASGSFHHEEVSPIPQKFVGERRKVVSRGRRPLPANG
ncbi:hypothetical protein Krac_0470 [Ktedonobacter racemifer DSM 44963]|uniref:Cytochrome c oxidase polypeptide IV n=2 Tax=Ktedonobacter racemifer TaxID=363277 RepID=D6U7T0_KTERA|nr:hypothetical protein Krac_0470 [Ktedonobacter racemifer DSM 44963]